MNRLYALPLLACCFSCDASGESGAGSGTDECGDLDGTGGDTGNIPNVLGDWTTAALAADFWKDNCTAAGFDSSSESWIGSFELSGSLANLRGEFRDENASEFTAALDERGGFTMSGEFAHTAGTLYANFAGLVYEDASGRTGIDGAAFLGLDVDADAVIDCYARSSWSANKSGL